MIWIVYLIVINALGFLLMHRDKKKAIRKQWRIPEATLMGVAAIGGSLGILSGMYAFRHKTRKKKFSLGVPAILIGQIALAVILLQWL